jgi:predicted nuclease of restriction endonuclease-like RecB superfamily
MCIDIKNFYLNSDLDHSVYITMLLSIFPKHIIEQYNMQQHATTCHNMPQVDVSIFKSEKIYSLLQTGA